MKFKHVFIGMPLLLFLFSACEENIDIDPQTISRNFIENIVVPNDFNFEMTYQQALEISLIDSNEVPLTGVPIYFYDQPWYEGGVLLGVGLSDEEGMVRTLFDLEMGGRALFAYTLTNEVVRSQRIELPRTGNTITYTWGENPSPSDSVAYRFTDPFTLPASDGSECTGHSLTNEDFETYDPAYYRTRSEGNLGSYAFFFDESDIEGWTTTAIDNQIELWVSGHEGVKSHSGNAHLEINAQAEAQLYQDLSTIPGSQVNWSLWHRGKHGIDIAGVYIGSSGGTLELVQEMSSGASSWQQYTGTYTVPVGQTSTRFSLQAIRSAGGDITAGNFVDLFEVEVCVPADAGSEVDSDGDGMVDDWDMYPSDRSAVFSDYFPSSSRFGSYAFEDSWPKKGDYDFNDLILDYQYEMVKNAANKITKVRLTYLARIVGSTSRLGFGLSFEDLSSFEISSVSGTQAPGIITTSNGIESGTAAPTVIVFDDIHELFGVAPGVLINSGDSSAIDQEALPIEVWVEFSTPLEELGTLNPFLFSGDDRSIETHFKGANPTSQANYSFLGSGDDASQGNLTYQTETGLAFGLNFPYSISPGMEGEVIIDAYPKFTPWVSSNGWDHPNWYRRVNSKLLKLNPRYR